MGEREQRSLPENEKRVLSTLNLPVKSGRQVLYPDRCCFGLADSNIIFLVDILTPRPNPSQLRQLEEEARQLEEEAKDLRTDAALAALAAVMRGCRDKETSHEDAACAQKDIGVEQQEQQQRQQPPIPRAKHNKK